MELVLFVGCLAVAGKPALSLPKGRRLTLHGLQDYSWVAAPSVAWGWLSFVGWGLPHQL